MLHTDEEGNVRTTYRAPAGLHTCFTYPTSNMKVRKWRCDGSPCKNIFSLKLVSMYVPTQNHYEHIYDH